MRRVTMFRFTPDFFARAPAGRVDCVVDDRAYVIRVDGWEALRSHSAHVFGHVNGQPFDILFTYNQRLTTRQVMQTLLIAVRNRHLIS